VTPSDQISPALKSWLDHVIVPALVSEYLAEAKRRNEFACQSSVGVESPKTTNPNSEKNA